MARMLAEADYGRWVRAADDPAARFADEALRTHRRTNRLLHHSRWPTLPWPRALGTQPWAIARELPERHRVLPVNDRAGAWEAILHAGSPVPLYVGNRLLPRHVVLVIGADTEVRMRVYEPSAGVTVPMTRPDFLEGRLDLAGWEQPWFVVTPR